MKIYFSVTDVFFYGRDMPVLYLSGHICFMNFFRNVI